eukprot:CAMPEP_0176235050 /NCGR_PEP_ID=MMETSP0121_2-20121125/26638_1 /TAXON_ID=160619 /ORGANISM="Kryptoperidinium foliaceum, Strain CCMP 1326" /LENGTH=122 /DNA_ID=CAMNT_0017574459 /DNA_START=75 /DNA_END=441 /DNA_ORIENTATION=-
MTSADRGPLGAAVAATTPRLADRALRNPSRGDAGEGGAPRAGCSRATLGRDCLGEAPRLPVDGAFSSRCCSHRSCKVAPRLQLLARTLSNKAPRSWLLAWEQDGVSSVGPPEINRGRTPARK